MSNVFVGLPYFPENDNQVFGAGNRFGGLVLLFPKIGHQGLVLGTNLGWVSTPWGTRKVELVPGTPILLIILIFVTVDKKFDVTFSDPVPVQA